MNKWISKGFQGFKIVAQVAGLKKAKLAVTVINKLFNKNKESKMQQFKSKKFLMTFWPVLSIILGSFLAPEAVEASKEVFLGVLAAISVYNGSQAHVDGKNKK